MTAEQDQQHINTVTEKIIGCAHLVLNALGAGFLEKVYENALVKELRDAGLNVQQQHPVQVFYKSIPVGDFIADLLVEDCVIVEMKAVRALEEIHAAQCLNYLKATGLSVCLLLNFAKPRLEVKRIVLGF